MTEMFSADSHAFEPPEVFEGLEERFGSRAPRVLRNGRGDRWAVKLGSLPVAVGRFGVAGLPDGEVEAMVARGYDGVPASLFDPAARLRDMEADGVSGEVLYPSVNMLTFALKDRDVAHAVFRRHNDWLTDFCAAAPSRLVGVACLGLPEVDLAVAELRRVGERMPVAAIPCSIPAKGYDHPDHEALWQAAEEMDVALALHVHTGTTLDMGLPAHWGTPGVSILAYSLATCAAAASVKQIICSGVLARHPRLRIIVAEFEAGWVAHFLHRLDHAAEETQHELAPNLDRPPSEYFRSNFLVTFQDDAVALATRHLAGITTMAWGNDYPHRDSTWPRSRDVLDRIFAGVPDEERRLLTSENARRFLGARSAAASVGSAA